MTKAQLIAKLQDLPNDCDVLIRAVAQTNNFNALINSAAVEQKYDPEGGDLSEIGRIAVYEDDGASAPAFAVIHHICNYQ